MRSQPWQRVLHVAAALCGLSAGAFILAADEVAQPPLFAGKTIAEWQARMGQIDFAAAEFSDDLPGLVELVQSSDVPWFTRRQAALTLGRMKSGAADAFPVLIRLLESPTDPIEASPALWAAKAIALAGPAAANATTALGRLLEDVKTPHLLRLSCIDALGQIGTQSPQAVAVLERQLRREVVACVKERPPRNTEAGRSHISSEVRAALCESLGVAGPSAALAVPIVVRLLDDRSILVRRAAVDLCAGLGPLATDCEPVLSSMVVLEEDRDLQRTAAFALGKVATRMPEVVNELERSQDVTNQLLAVNVLAGLAARDASVAQRLHASLTHSRDEVALAAALVLGDLPDFRVPVRAALVRLSASSVGDVRRYATKRLKDVPVPDKPR